MGTTVIHSLSVCSSNDTKAFFMDLYFYNTRKAEWMFVYTCVIDLLINLSESKIYTGNK